MSQVFPASPPPYPSSYDDRMRRPWWIFPILGLLVFLIIFSVLMAVLVAVVQGTTPTWWTNQFPWEWVIGLVVVVVAIALVMTFVRLVVWGVVGPSTSRRFWRHYYRHYYSGGPYGFDPAVAVARDRLARGEITPAQYNEILRSLGVPPGPPGPA